MKHSVQVGQRIFESKKGALNHYKAILNSYDFGENLSRIDFDEVFALLETHPSANNKIGSGIKSILVSKSKYNTRSFELVRADNSREYFSYTKRINSPKNDFTRFSEACRNLIQEDLRNVKLAFFKEYSKKGRVRCQETGELLKYESLVVDHRQPNTFSVIVDRFIEIHRLSLRDMKYIVVDGGPNEISDIDLQENFRQFHKEKANLRLVKKDLNLGRSYQARITRQKKDLVIE